MDRDGWGLIRVLDEVPELAVGMSEHEQHRGRRSAVCSALDVPARRCLDPSSAMPSTGAGLLVTRGLMLRRVHAADHWSAEIAGRGDVVSADAPGFWTVIEPARVAVIEDPLFEWPALRAELFRRTADRNERLCRQMAIVAIADLDRRLPALFAYLAERWGQRVEGGRMLELSLSHEMLSALSGAWRPSITRALTKLLASGELARTVEGRFVIPDAHRAETAGPLLTV